MMFPFTTLSAGRYAASNSGAFSWEKACPRIAPYSVKKANTFVV